MPYLLNIHMDIFKGRGDASVPQQVLDDVKVALGLLHQISSDSVSEPVRTYVHAKLAT